MPGLFQKTLGIQVKENFVFHGLNILQVLFTEEWILSGHSSSLVGAAEMIVLLEGFPLSTEQQRLSVRVTLEFLVTSLTKVLLSQLLRLAGGQL